MTNIKNLEQQAIDFAIASEWEDAVSMNKKIIELDEENLQANLRLGYSYVQLNQFEEAKKIYTRALEIQPKNHIAEEYLEKIEILSKKKKKRSNEKNNFDPNLFIDIPGKTRTVSLVNLGQKEDLADLNTGQSVVIKVKKHKIEIRTKGDDYLGCLPDDISKRLKYFISEGSDYEYYIKESDLNSVIIFIKEINKGNKVKHYPSFPSNSKTMLSDINQIKNDMEDEEYEDVDEDDVDGEDDDLEDDIVGPDDEKIKSFEEGEDLSSIIHMDDEDEEEE